MLLETESIRYFYPSLAVSLDISPLLQLHNWLLLFSTLLAEFGSLLYFWGACLLLTSLSTFPSPLHTSHVDESFSAHIEVALKNANMATDNGKGNGPFAFESEFDHFRCFYTACLQSCIYMSSARWFGEIVQSRTAKLETSFLCPTRHTRSLVPTPFL